MKTFKITFNGRTKGAIGIFYDITDTFQGDTLEDAKLNMYDKYEPIRIKHVMSFYRVTYENGNVSETGFNGTLEDAKSYYLNQSFQFGDTEEKPFDDMVKAINVEQI